MIELGFQNWILVFFFLSGLITSFVIRWKWNNAVERKKEIMRLVAMASEEAARVELEAAKEYVSVSVPPEYVSVRPSHQCAVCYCPTTTRCARCKAVHYCSGKCQIIHWRLGHKDECYPPKITSQFNGPESDTDSKLVSLGDQGEAYANDVDTKEHNKAKPIETPIEKLEFSKSIQSSFMDDGKVDQAPVVSESTSTSLFVGSSDTIEKSLADASLRGSPISNTPDGLEEPLINDIAKDGLDADAKVNDIDLSKSPPPSYNSTSDVSADGISYSESTNSLGSNIDLLDGSKVHKLSIPVSDFWEEALDSNGSRDSVYDGSTHSSLSEGGEGKLADSNSLLQYSLNSSEQPAPNSQSEHSETENHFSDHADPINLWKGSSAAVPLSEKIVTDMSTEKGSPTIRFETVNSGDNINSDSQLLGRRARSLSSSSSGDNSYSGSGEQPISNVKFSKVDTPNVMPSGSPGTVTSILNGSNGLKGSMRKVVQQFKLYKPSKHYANGFECERSEKYHYKMLFPYEQFIQLYHWNKVELRPCGLTNNGNSCYANSVLQCLTFTRPLTAYLLQGFHSKACPKKEWCFMCEFEGLILKAKERKSPVSPIGILSQLQRIGSHLRYGREEDAHEFLRYVIDTMQSVCLNEAGDTAVGPLAEETTLIGLIFGGYLQSKIKCMKCHGKSERRERMMDLTIEIQGDIGTLEEALRQFTATEILDKENKYNCLRCRSYEKAKKKFTILDAPNVLTIALKRFQSGKFGKLNKPVVYPEILDLAPYMSGTSDKSPIYRLYAVIVHRDTENATFSGHYVCYVRIIQGKWFNIDDSTVEPVDLERVLSQKAYMLLYARCSPRAPSLIRNTRSSKIKDISGCQETIPSTNGTIDSTARPFSTVPRSGTAQRRAEVYPYWINSDGPVSYEYLNSYDRGFHPMHRIHKVDSSSDSSSLLSCSDEGSCSTESTRDSASTDDFPDFVFGEAGYGLNSPSRVFGDSDSSSPSAGVYPSHYTDEVLSSQFQESGRRRKGWQENGVFHSNTDTHSRNIRNYTDSNNSSGSTESELERLGRYTPPLDVNSGVSQRRLTRERTVQTFY